jgi:hypothetical protein
MTVDRKTPSICKHAETKKISGEHGGFSALRWELNLNQVQHLERHPVGNPEARSKRSRRPSERRANVHAHTVGAMRIDTLARRGWLQQSQPLILRTMQDDKLACSARRQRRSMQASMANLRTQNEQEGRKPASDKAGRTRNQYVQHGVRSEPSRLVRRYTDVHAAWKGTTATPEVPCTSVADRVPRVYRKGVRIWRCERAHARPRTEQKTMSVTGLKGRRGGLKFERPISIQAGGTLELNGHSSLNGILRSVESRISLREFWCPTAKVAPEGGDPENSIKRPHGVERRDFARMCQATFNPTILDPQAERGQGFGPRLCDEWAKGGDREVPEGERCI